MGPAGLTKGCSNLILSPRLSTQALPFKIYGALIDVRGPATRLMLLQRQAFGL